MVDPFFRADEDSDVVGLAFDVLKQQITKAQGNVFRLTQSGEPDLLLIHPHVGIVAINIAEPGAEVGHKSGFLSLNEQLHTVQQNLGLDFGKGVGRVLVHMNEKFKNPVKGIGDRLSISALQLLNLDWMANLNAHPIPDAVMESLVEELNPSFTFSTLLRTGAEDPGMTDREALRVRLDAEQEAAAKLEGIEVALIKGPPGSGKTLVLAARAKWLSTKYPHWRIRFLCYNNALVPYLRSLLQGYPNIEVSTMWPYAKELGLHFSFDDEQINNRSLHRAKLHGISPIADAVLIDEAQDFNTSWLEIIEAGLKPGRGGMFLAGDAAQALYGVHEIPDDFERAGVTVIELTKPYRSTKQILAAIRAVDSEFEVSGLDYAPDGEPVVLVNADSREEQARAAAWEIAEMIVSGQREPRDIAVVLSQIQGNLANLRQAFDEFEIPYTAVVTKEDKKTFDRTLNTVKIITAHSAKGNEFPVVILFGVDMLKSLDRAEEKLVRQARAVFVGATRAKDLLLITFTKRNSYIDAIESNGESMIPVWLWPDQYSGVPGRG